jgi:hypothetical protein
MRNGGLLVHITALKSSAVNDKDTEIVSDQHPPSSSGQMQRKRGKGRDQRGTLEWLPDPHLAFEKSGAGS